jgi:ribosomal protein S18 acetylase RimI-like enzyme
MAALVERLAWDSDFFGRPIGRARVGRLDATTANRLLGEARDAGLECVYLVLVADDPGTVAVAEASGFHLVDVRVVYDRAATAPLPALEDAETFHLEPARDAELPRLEDLAVQVSRVSRYAFDSRFPASETERLYRAWIANALHGFADVVLVARERPDGEALGFLCGKMHGELCDLQLAGVDERYRLRKVGRALFSGGVGWARANGASRVQIVTQARNVAAQRLFQQLGFLTSEVRLCYHLWLTPDAQLHPAR